MTHRLNLDMVDRDGALRETAAQAQDALRGETRASFLRKAGLAGGAVIGGGALLGALVPSGALAAGAHTAMSNGRPPASFGPGDIGILNYALTLEYLEAQFYNEAAAHGAVTDPQTKVFLAATVRDEDAHVAFLQQALGSKAVAKPRFDFQGIVADQTKFQQTAYVLENTGVHAYLGQAGNIENPAYLAAAASILTIEARHASVIGLIIDESVTGIAPNGSFDTPLTAEQVLAAVAATGFIVA